MFRSFHNVCIFFFDQWTYCELQNFCNWTLIGGLYDRMCLYLQLVFIQFDFIPTVGTCTCNAHLFFDRCLLHIAVCSNVAWCSDMPWKHRSVCTVASLGRVGGGPPWVTPSRGWHPNETNFFALEGGEGGSGDEMMAKKGHHFSEDDDFFQGKKRARPSVAAAGDTNLSDATESVHALLTRWLTRTQ